MDLIAWILSQGWLGSVIGIAGLVAAYFFYRASRIGARPTYQMRSLRLIGREQQALPDEVEILFKGRHVDRLTMTHLILWNSGKALLNGEEMVLDDPLRAEVSLGADVLRVRVQKVTRLTNKFLARINPQSQNQVLLEFDYLDPGDGAVVEMLHTDQRRYPEVKATFRGVPRGILNWGTLPVLRPRRLLFGLSNPKYLGGVATLLGIALVVFGLALPGTLLDVTPAPDPRRLFTWAFLSVGAVNALFGAFLLWLVRSRFPRALVIDEFIDSAGG